MPTLEWDFISDFLILHLLICMFSTPPPQKKKTPKNICKHIDKKKKNSREETITTQFVI